MSQVIPLQQDTGHDFDFWLWRRLLRFTVADPDALLGYCARIVAESCFRLTIFLRGLSLCFPHEPGNILEVVGVVVFALFFVGCIVGSPMGKHALFVSFVVGSHLFSGGVFCTISLSIQSIILSSGVKR